MKKNRRPGERVLSPLLLAGVVAAAVAGPTLRGEPAPSWAPTQADAFVAINDPDRFAWQLFCAISVPVENDNPQDIMWENWLEQEEIYADPHVAPQWPSAEFKSKQLKPSVQQAARLLASGTDGWEKSTPVPKPRDGVSNEEVRNNKDAFDYIVANNLWYQEGITDKVRNDDIEFPPGSISIKGKWKVISEEQKPRFHWHDYTDSKTGEKTVVGLVALHIVSRVLPNWHWSTFEQIDNPGLADYIGVHDSFGMKPADLWPNRRTNQGYSEVYGKPKENVGVLTEELKAMMKKHNLSPALSNFYRLKGAQVDFTDRTGRPTIVGNSITEAGFVSTSSCITCHARATVGAPYQGQNKYPVPKPLSVFTERGESHNGPVDPNWFWDPTAPFSLPQAEPEAYRKSVEFLWQLVFGPKPRHPAPADKK